MSAIKSIFARLHRDKRGATMVEYSVLIALVTIGTIVMIGNVGGKVLGNWTTLNLAL
jgi:Flp pilus assembly pilin Flp